MLINYIGGVFDVIGAINTNKKALYVISEQKEIPDLFKVVLGIGHVSKIRNKHWQWTVRGDDAFIAAERLAAVTLYKKARLEAI